MAFIEIPGLENAQWINTDNITSFWDSDAAPGTTNVQMVDGEIYRFPLKARELADLIEGATNPYLRR